MPLTKFTKCVLFLSCWSMGSCWFGGLQPEFPVPQHPRYIHGGFLGQWSRHDGLLNLALRGLYRPTSSVTPPNQNLPPPNQYLPPASPDPPSASPDPPAANPDPPPVPPPAVTGHGASPQQPPIGNIAGSNRSITGPSRVTRPDNVTRSDPVTEEQPAPWAPVATFQRTVAAASRPTGFDTFVLPGAHPGQGSRPASEPSQSPPPAEEDPPTPEGTGTERSPATAPGNQLSADPVSGWPPPSHGQRSPPSPLHFQHLPPQRTKFLVGQETLSGGSGAKTSKTSASSQAGTPNRDSVLDFDGFPIKGSDGIPSSIMLSSELLQVVGQSSGSDQERQRPLVVYFEGMHFRNKATEPGFCQSICARPSQTVEVKAGKCPPIRPGTYRGDCHDLCKYDSECPKQQRCCNVGCANVCLDPVFRKTCDDFDFHCPEGYACIDDPAKIKDAYCVNTTNKVGRCPAPELWDSRTRRCDQECSYDFQCPADERCCFNGCAMVCVAPDLRKRCEDHNCEEGYACVDDGVNDAKCISTAARAGRCPRWTPDQYRQCGEDQCQYDEQCPDGEKCCHNGCASVCVKADTRKLCSDIECPSGTACIENPVGDAQCFDTAEKDGLCPRISNDTQPRGGCRDTCQYDSQCDDNSKCCFNGCAYVCLRPRKPDCEQIKCKVGYKCSEDRHGSPICSPIPCKQDGEIIDIECNSCTCIQGYLLCSQEECPPVKPGFCPKITKGYKGKCVEDCNSDYNCADKNKCCWTGCGHTCQKPVPEIVHPCKTVRFRCGDVTRCAATRGLCQPGKTCPLSPLCVSTRAPFCESCPPGKVCVLQKKACPSGGSCHRQPICVQLYSDDTIFEEDEDLEQEVVARQNPGRKTG